jgi:hypothetical protein
MKLAGFTIRLSNKQADEIRRAWKEAGEDASIIIAQPGLLLGSFAIKNVDLTGVICDLQEAKEIQKVLDSHPWRKQEVAP